MPHLCRLATVPVIGCAWFELLNVRLVRQSLFEWSLSLRALLVGPALFNGMSHGPYLFRFVATAFLFSLLVIGHRHSFSHLCCTLEGNGPTGEISCFRGDEPGSIPGYNQSKSWYMLGVCRCRERGNRIPTRTPTPCRPTLFHRHVPRCRTRNRTLRIPRGRLSPGLR
jgi:hypothetical protein